MKNYKNIIFDLDGTLTDSKEGIIDSLDYSLQHFGIKIEKKKLEKYIGEPLFKIYREVLKTEDKEKIDLAVSLYRKKFEDEGMYRNKLYNGVYELLDGLSRNGKNLFLATIKPTRFAQKILEHFSLMNFFKYVQGTEMDGSNASKEELINSILTRFNIEKTSTVMVGDRKSDFDGAIFNSIDSIIVCYGYIDENEKKLIKPTFFANDVFELKQILIGEKNG
ncbi:MAG: HAD hydrolase-like protein [candidate division WOR-3 bacterium]|jgi:phosphoglycolate phosphatase